MAKLEQGLGSSRPPEPLDSPLPSGIKRPSLPPPPPGKPPRKRHVKLWVTLGILAVMLGSVGTAFGVYHHQNRELALPGIRVAGKSVAGMNEPQLAKFIDAKVRDTKLELQGAAVPAVSASELGITVDSKQTTREVLKPNRQLATFITAMFQEKKVPLKLQVDYATLYAKAVALTPIQGQSRAPIEPAIKADAKSEKFEVTAGQPGFGINPYWLKDQMVQALNQNDPKTVQVKNEVVQPFHREAELHPLVDEANGYLTVKLELQGQEELYQAKTSEKIGFVKIPSGVDKLPEHVDIDREAIGKWVEKQGEAENTPGTNGIRMLNAAGKIITVRSEKKDGKEVSNLTQLKTGAAESFAAKKDFVQNMELKTVPAKWEDKVAAPGAETMPFVASAGEKWIDINTSPEVRTVTGYVGTEKVSGPYPMVPGNPGTPTITGQFKVYIKRSTQTMRGFNPDGTRYELPNIHWILYFHGDYATHSASNWRSTFGPGAPGGSHGCVNMAEDTAKAIYDFADLGTPVVVHN